MAGDVKDFRAAIAAQEFSPILTHRAPVFVRVVLFSCRARLAVSICLGAADSAPLRAVGNQTGLRPVGEVSAGFGARLLRVAAGRRLVLVLGLHFNVLSQCP